MYLVSKYNYDGFLEEGEYIEAISFCKTNCAKGKCLDYYKQLMQNEKGRFYTCPFGMSSFISTDGTVLTCMRERKTYNKKLAANIRNANEKAYNPILDSTQLLSLINASFRINSEERRLDEKRASIDSISHEVKQLNAQIKEKCDVILQNNKLSDPNGELSLKERQSIEEEIKTIFVSSSMIASRFSLYDYEKNPSTLSQGAYPCVVYKKFDKIRKILNNYQKRKIDIKISGSSFQQIKAYSSFELIPLLLIENAVKYSYESNSVQIDFIEKDNRLRVTIKSFSPYCSEEDLKHVFEKGYRGKNAMKVAEGSGIGLYFVKMLCKVHSVDISVTSDNKSITDISGVAYAPFSVVLDFTKTIKE